MRPKSTRTATPLLVPVHCDAKTGKTSGKGSDTNRQPIAVSDARTLGDALTALNHPNG